MIPPELATILRLLPAPVVAIEQLGGPGRPWSIRYGSRSAVLRRTDLGRYRSFGVSDEVGLASVAWLHDYLGALAVIGFSAPAPITDLDGRSLAVANDDVWELLSHVPGRPMGWTDPEIKRAGALLARFHAASLATPARPQRPGSMPLESCRPSDPDARDVRARFDREYPAIAGSPRGVIHGDATQSNVVIDDAGDYHLVDFAIAYEDLLYADIGSALWRNGRIEPNAVAYDPGRVARFVGGYAGVRPIAPSEARAVVTCMKGRGLQLARRLELRRGSDATVIQRLLAIQAQQDELVAAIEAALEPS